MEGMNGIIQYEPMEFVQGYEAFNIGKLIEVIHHISRLKGKRI